MCRKVAFSLSVEVAHDGEADDEEGDGGNLITGPDQRGKDKGVGRRAEDVAVHLFPPVFVPEVPLHVVQVVFLRISRVVLPQSSHEDHGDQADQEDDHHERIEDGKPVNLDKTEITSPIPLTMQSVSERSLFRSYLLYAERSWGPSTCRICPRRECWMSSIRPRKWKAPGRRAGA